MGLKPGKVKSTSRAVWRVQILSANFLALCLATTQRRPEFMCRARLASRTILGKRSLLRFIADFFFAGRLLLLRDMHSIDAYKGITPSQVLFPTVLTPHHIFMKCVCVWHTLCAFNIYIFCHGSCFRSPHMEGYIQMYAAGKPIFSFADLTNNNGTRYRRPHTLFRRYSRACCCFFHRPICWRL